MKRLLIATVTGALLLTGCTAGSDSRTATGPRATGPAASSLPADGKPLLAKYGLDGKSPVEVVDYLDRLARDKRPTDLMASVRPKELAISSGTEKVSLDLPPDRFYLSVAPYVNRTHDCFYHSLTTCKGELAVQEVQVRIVDQTNDKVLVDEVRTTFDNGFVGFWLPRDIKGSLRVSYDGRVAETAISTGQDAPTCLTTVNLT
ncbi:MAG: CueP family metal-binding protein [Micromonospora sp.]